MLQSLQLWNKSAVCSFELQLLLVDPHCVLVIAELLWWQVFFCPTSRSVFLSTNKSKILPENEGSCMWLCSDCLSGWWLFPFKMLIVNSNTTLRFNLHSIMGQCFVHVITIMFYIHLDCFSSAELVLIRSFYDVSSLLLRGEVRRICPSCTEECAGACVSKSSWKSLGVRRYLTHLLCVLLLL